MKKVIIENNDEFVQTTDDSYWWVPRIEDATIFRTNSTLFAYTLYQVMEVSSGSILLLEVEE